MTGLVSDGHTIERYHKKYFAQTNNLTIARNVNKENRLCLVIYNPNAKHRRIANATTLGHIIKYIFGLFMLGPGVHFSFDVLPMGADQGSPRITSAYVKIFRTVTRKAVNKRVWRKKTVLYFP